MGHAFQDGKLHRASSGDSFGIFLLDNQLYLRNKSINHTELVRDYYRWNTAFARKTNEKAISAQSKRMTEESSKSLTHHVPMERNTLTPSS